MSKRRKRAIEKQKTKVESIEKRSTFRLTNQLADADIRAENEGHVETGHGRKRSQEWNSEERKKLEKELAELRKRRKRDELGDNEFDRMAMK